MRLELLVLAVEVEDIVEMEVDTEEVLLQEVVVEDIVEEALVDHEVLDDMMDALVKVAKIVEDTEVVLLQVEDILLLVVMTTEVDTEEDRVEDQDIVEVRAEELEDTPSLVVMTMLVDIENLVQLHLVEMHLTMHTHREVNNIWKNNTLVYNLGIQY